MPPKVPPPPRPDPVTLDHIYECLTAADSSMDDKAYHLVALQTVAFHPSVKLFLFEYTPLSTLESTAAAAAQRLNQLRRENVVKQIAFFLAQRTNTVCQECRWETVSLLGELCRFENTQRGATTSPKGVTEAKINAYAKLNLEYLAQLPWFVPAIKAVMGPKYQENVVSEEDVKSASGGGTSRDVLQRTLRARRQIKEDEMFSSQLDEGDEDVVIALSDVLRALPRVVSGTAAGGVTKDCVWDESALKQASDLMFIDATTAMLHLIPPVSRSSHLCCAQCLKKHVPLSTGDGVGEGSKVNGFLRCSSCKAVYYCSPECQRVHWAAAHRVPCKAYKERCETLLEQYYALNRGKGKRKGGPALTGISVVEVPLEPSLFFETRRYLYDHRDPTFAEVSFDEYFMKYTVVGS